MLDPYSLFSYEPHVDARTIRARTLVITLGSFADAGHAQRLVDDHMLNTLTSHRLGTFDADQLISYREQRPMVVFSVDEFTQYHAPTLALHQVEDAAGEPFLLLTGPEPGLQWERMAAAVQHVIATHDVERTVIAQSMPMPVPHTRPVVISRWASRSELIPGNRSMFGTVLMSASFPAMLAKRLGEAGRDVVGLTAHVPHYLADHDFPDAAIALVDAVRAAASLDIPTLQLAVAAGVVRAQIGHQMEQSEELTEHVQQLEESYDEFSRQRELQVAAEDLPSADEIGEAAEEFLKTFGDTDGEAPDASQGALDSAEDEGETAVDEGDDSGAGDGSATSA